jgi:hypothetical protein
MKKFPVLAATLTALSLTAAACGNGTTDGSKPSDRQESASRQPDLDVVIDQPGDATVRKHKVTVTGSAQPATAVVDLNGHPVVVQPDGSWEKVVYLELGDNDVDIHAALPGSTQRSTDSITVTRRRTAAERARYLEAQRRKREEHLAALRTNASWLEPKLFQKDPDRYTGESVAMRGEVFQIQEGRGSDNFLLMNTECETEYDITICGGPTVHVEYDFSTNTTEDDVVTVYGTVNGGLEYDTAMGGTNYVGSIAAEIIE